MRKAFQLVLTMCIAVAFTAASAQDVATRGSIGGVITDATGAAIPGAKVIVTGPTGIRDETTNESGIFRMDNLTPGSYKVRVEQSGFKAAQADNVTVYVGRDTPLNLKLEPGDVSATVDVTGEVGGIDQQSTAVGQNLNDQLFENIPVQRSVTSLFYLAPGVNDSGAGGRANPSISGGSPLDNLYIADGVNITDSAFGGLGTFSRNYLTLGVGINTSFIKEVQVKTGGFEPQYGQSQGGIVNIITQSGSNEFHGAVYGFVRPKSFEATRRQPDDVRVNKFGKLIHEENYDAGVDIGGYVPGRLRNKLFFFGSFNPTIRRELVRGAEGSGLRTILGDEYSRRYRSLNYAFKLDYNISQNHTVAFSIFGDPTKTNIAPFATLNIDNATALNQLVFGTRSIAVRYNGALSPSWTLSGSFSQGKNHFDETGFADFNQITDRTQPARGNFVAIGYGFLEPTDGKTYRASVDTLKQFTFTGSHSIGLGYQFQRSTYSGVRDRSGPKYTIPATNATGVPLADIIGPEVAALAVGQQVNATWSLFPASTTDPTVCPLCPILNVPGQPDIGLGAGNTRVYLRQERGEYGITSFNTFSRYHAAYIQDTWRLNKYFTALVGLRFEQERLVGNPGLTGNRIAYSFTGNVAPRLGFTVDPFGKGKTKVYYNFGRFYEFIPLDLAERSLSAESDFRLGRFAPVFTTDATGERFAVRNSLGAVTPIIDAAHLLTDATGGTGTSIATSVQDPTNPILPGTKLGFAQEHIIGFEQQLPRNFVVSVRYLDRRLRRIIEDAAVVSPEGAFTDLQQTYFIGNINSHLDAAVNPIPHVFPVGGPVPSACTDPGLVNSEVTNSAGNVVGAICYEPLGVNGKAAGSGGADGIPDGFPDPVHVYRALEIEVNKRFSNSWQLLSNWRIASLRGNFEGHFRNDNGQTDPGISSLFDFTGGEFGLLGDQFSVGPLNTDRRHIANIYGSYAFSKDSPFARRLDGLNIGAGLHMESGTPISSFLAHPVYSNAGEIPTGGRGSLGRTPFYAKLDLHSDYRYALNEKMRLIFIADFFNVTNNRRLRFPDQNVQSTLGQNNPDFLKPGIIAIDLNRGFYLPFSMRLGMRFEF
jgi:Carboxypeptidase regulatory-like domain/TonB-dependent Receptor Plug Domain